MLGGMRVVVSRVVGWASLLGGGEELRSTYGAPREVFELGAKRRDFFGTLLGFSISELGSVLPAAHGGPRGWEVRASSTKTTACVSLLKQAVPKPLLRKQYLISLLRYQSTSAASESVAKYCFSRHCSKLLRLLLLRLLPWL